MENQNSGLISNDAESLKFPFLGSLADGELFEYLLLSMNADFVEIALLEWFVNRAKLHIGDKINLHLPNLLSSEFMFRGEISGTVVTAKRSEEIGGEIYQISLSKSDQFTKQLQATASLTDILVSLIKDSMILKAGIRVYLKHLIPYFSRITDYSHREYAQLETYFLHDVEIHIMNNIAELDRLYQVIKQKLKNLTEVPIYIDLEALRSILESEVSSPLFNIIFSQEKGAKIQEKQFYAQSQHSMVSMYINAIKNLEKRLYSNYNNIVIIYLKSLTL